MLVINPDPYLTPHYRISPFRTEFIENNYNLRSNSSIDNYFRERFNSNNYIYTLNGRTALNIALSYYKLNSDEIVTILTTSGNSYISKCVTSEIEKFCKWSHTIESKTKILLVNHEFGFPYKDLTMLRKYKLPIIEDCAHSFFSHDIKMTTGQIGDFVIYSFPKIFPIQIGGLLRCNFETDYLKENKSRGNNEITEYIKKTSSYYIASRDHIIYKRIKNYLILRNLFENNECAERFKITKGIVPGVFMFKIRTPNLNLDDLKVHFINNGIECSVFYGESSFFLPCHQNLTNLDLQYFYEVYNNFFQKS